MRGLRILQSITVSGRGEKEAGRGRVARQSYNSGMALKDVLSLIDAEIATLKEARALLAAGSAVTEAKRKPGRPRKVQPDSPKVTTRT